MGAASTEREYWYRTAVRIARPVLAALAGRTLKASMPVEGAGDPRYDRKHFTYLEALARTLAGIAPWLECRGLEGEEEVLRAEMAALARSAVDAATDPASPDFLDFGFSFQPIVEAAFLGHALLRAPGELLEKLDPRVKGNLEAAFRATRSRKPHFNNWLLFAAMVEAGLSRLGAEWDRMRVDYAFRQHEEWYAGDGIYGDGPDFHWDYYNSYVIQPMLVDLVDALGNEYADGRPSRRISAGGPSATPRSRRGSSAPMGASRRWGARWPIAAAPSSTSRRPPCNIGCPRASAPLRSAAAWAPSFAARSRRPAPSPTEAGSASASAVISPSWARCTSRRAASTCASLPSCPSGFRQPIPSGPIRPWTGHRSASGRAASRRWIMPWTTKLYK